MCFLEATTLTIFGPMLWTSLLLALALPTALLAQSTASAHLQLAREAYLAGDLEPALAHADSAIKLENELPGAYKLRGDIKQRQSNLHGALLDYTRAEKQDASDPRLYVSRSAIHITEGRLKDAMRDVEKALKLDPNEADAWYNSACANYLGHNNDAALRDLHRAVELKENNADALFLRGVVKGELFKEESGLADIEAALKLKPGIQTGEMSAGILLFELERYEEAIARFTKVIDANGADIPEAYYYRADCWYGLENKERACEDWSRSGELGDPQAQFIVRNYCNTDAEKIPRKPRKERKTVIEF